MKHSTLRTYCLFALMVWGLQPFASAQRSYTVTPGGELQIRASSGDFNIELYDGSQIVLSYDDVQEENLRIDAGSSLFTLEYEGGYGWDEASFELRVPSRFNLDIQTGAGDVSIVGDLVGNLAVSTQGGDVEFGSVEGEARIRSSGGDIEGGSVSGNSEVRTLGGDIELGDVGGTLEVNTHGGDIEVENVGGTIRAKTLGGDIEIGNVSGEADVSTLGGDIDIGEVATRATLKTSGGDIELSSAGGEVVAETSGGDIELNNVAGSVQALTAGGDIEVVISAQGSGPSRLVSKGGDLTLSLPAGVSATVEATIRISGAWSDEEDYSIESDFPASSQDVERRGKEKRATFQINGGGPIITLETVNGNIYINRR